MDAQSSRKKGDIAWDKGKYKTAVNSYSDVKDISKDKELLAKRGLGYFKLNMLKRAINDFTLSKKLGNEDPYLFFLMGQAKHHLNEYEEASFFYKQYVNEVGDDTADGKMALKEIKNCAYSAFHKKDRVAAFVENFGEEVNTYYDEVYVLQSPRQGNSFYFSSNRNLTDNEVFSFQMDKTGEWRQLRSRLKGINTKMDEYVMDISPDAQSMLFNRTTGYEVSNKIFVSTWDEEEKQHIIELPEYLIDGAVDLQIVDRNTIAFASKELGGEGGYDIFTINYKNGVWSDPINQGPIINTEYDERSPFYASTSDYLYFSSDRPYCYGGFDIYYYNVHSIESEPKNLGTPINSSGNDLQFRLHTDGQMAVMASDRKTGEGAYDIYKVYMHDFKPMPPRDTAQLEYVQDYLNSLKPKEVKTHLDKLKDKMADDVQDAKDKIDQASEKEDKKVIVQKDKDDDKDIAVVNDSEKKQKVSKPKKRVTSSTKKGKADKRLADNNKKRTTKKTDKDVVPKKASGESPLSSIKKTAAGETQAIPDAIVGESEKNTILYQDRHDLMNGVNRGKMESLVEYLNRNEDHSVHFIAHTDHLEPGLSEYMQYNTLKRANLLAQYLMDNGIDHDRVSIESVCNNFPVVKKELAGTANTEYLAYNKRVDWELRNEDGFVLMGHSIDKTKIPGYALDRRYELFHQVREELYYSVEIASSTQIVKNAVLRLYPDIFIRKADPLAENKYYIGIYNKFDEVLLLQKELAESSAPYAKIVAFYNGMPIKENQKKKLAEEYPDLDKFLMHKGD